ncbi:MAG: hypothetical protein HDS84_02450 [Bacteroidales bacterium]|nr:hypothetical protein [Bacteroidales bacterium]MBD5301993.1 hypothetical protein [Bacteroides sp.]
MLSPDVTRHVPTFVAPLHHRSIRPITGASARTYHYRTCVGTWRATSEQCDDVLFTMFAQTWHATSLHLPPHYIIASSVIHLSRQSYLTVGSKIYNKFQPSAY